MPAQEIERSRREKIPLIFEVSHCVQTLGAARISGNENQVTFRGARLTPLQEMFRVHCLAVLVGSEKADVQVVTSSMPMRMFSSRSTHFGSSERLRASKPDLT